MRKFAVMIPTWRRPKALTKLFKKCPALNDPSVFVGLEKGDREAYKEWMEAYGDKCTIVPVKNPNHYPSVAHQQLKEALPAGQYQRIVFTDDNATFTDASLFCLVYAHTLFPTGIVNGTNPIGTFFHKGAIEAGEVMPVPKAWQKFTLVDNITIFEQLNMTFWVMPADIYEKFTYAPNNYAWDIEVHLWAVIYGGVRNVMGCREAMFEKHKHDNRETGQAPSYKLSQLGESMMVLADRYPQYAKPTWMTYRVDTMGVLHSIQADESAKEKVK